MKRRLITLLAALSFVLFAAFAALWVRSCFRYDNLVRVEHDGITNFSSFSGRLVLQFGWTTFDIIPRAGRPYSEGFWVWELSGSDVGVVDKSRGWGWLGFDAYNWIRGDKSSGEFVVIVPYWFLCLVTVVLPARVAYVRLRIRRRRMLGLCARCGYDLRHASERCPECGMIVPRTIAIPAETD